MEIDCSVSKQMLEMLDFSPAHAFNPYAGAARRQACTTTCIVNRHLASKIPLRFFVTASFF